MKQEVIEGDALEKLKAFPDDYFSACCADPPYGLGKEPDIMEVMKGWIEKGYHEIKGKGFMNRDWDKFVPQPILWKEVFRVLKPGGHMLVACGTRTQDWMAASLRFAGFEIRDIVTQHYGAGFPKSLDISKAIDSHLGAERKVTGKRKHPTLKDPEKIKESKSAVHTLADTWDREWDITEPATDEAKRFAGYKTHIKPATELWTLCRKPLSENTIAENVLKHGTGGLNIEGCRISLRGEKQPTGSAKRVFSSNGFNKDNTKYGDNTTTPPSGRYPSNVIFDEHTAKLLDEQSGILTTGAMKKPYEYKNNGNSLGAPSGSTRAFHEANSGGASRFFYCSKSAKSERNLGLEDFYWEKADTDTGWVRVSKELYESLPESKRNFGNIHSTVKPISLCRWLVRLITPPGGIVLDPFGGSGTTGISCKLEGFEAVLIEREKDYCEIARARIAALPHGSRSRKSPPTN